MDKVFKAQVAKVDSSLGVVFGYAIVCKQNGEDYYDLQNDHIPENVMLEGAFEFMRGSRVAKSMHEGDPIGQIVFGFPLTEETAKSLDIDASRTGLLIGMRPDDDSVLEKFKSGEFTGFSIGGRCRREEV